MSLSIVPTMADLQHGWRERERLGELQWLLGVPS